MSGFEMRFELRTNLDVAGGATESIFPEVEKMLMGETDYQGALRFVAGRKDMHRYRCMVDFLFCEVFIEWRPQCFAFYDDERKPKLKDLIDEAKRAQYGRWLVAALNLAREKMEEKRAESWTSFRIQVLRLAA